MKIGFWEIVVILVVALLVVGPDKLPEYMRSLGKGLVSLRKATSEMTESLQEDVIQPLNEAAQPLKDAMEPVQEATDMINKETKKVQQAVKDVEHPVQAAKRKMKEESKPETWVCPNCGNTASGKFCNQCGTAQVTEPSETVSVEEAKVEVPAEAGKEESVSVEETPVETTKETSEGETL